MQIISYPKTNNGLKIIKQKSEQLTKLSNLKFDFLNNSFATLPLCKEKNCSQKIKSCKYLSKDVFTKIGYSKKPFVFCCPAGFKRVLVPLSVGGQPLGFLSAGENSRVPLDNSQIQILSGLLFQVANSFIKMKLNPSKNSYSHSQIHNHEKLKRVIKYIQENYYHSSLSLKELALNCSISYHYLSHLFKKELKINFVKYRNQVRVEAACRLLKNQKLKIAQISYAVGFEDPGYFCKVFQRQKGVSPLTYRYKVLTTTR